MDRALGPPDSPGTGRRARLAIAACALAGLLLRLGFGFGYWVGRPLTLDEQEYLTLAGNLASGRGFTYQVPDQQGVTPDHVSRAPLYPLFLAGVFTLASAADQPVSSVPGSVKLAQSLVGGVGIWLIAMLALRAAGTRAGVAAAAIAAVYPPLAWMCAYALSEPLYSVLALWTVLLLGAVLDRLTPAPGRPVARVLLAGVVAGLATLTRPAMLVFLLLAGLWMLARRRVALLAAFALGALLVVAPWTVRNVREHHRLILVASEGGVTFWVGNNPLARGEGDLAANPELKRARQAIRQRFAGLTEEQLEPIYYREALGFIASRPIDWAWLLVRKAFYLVVPAGPSYTLHSRLYFWTSVLSYGLLLPLAGLGLLTLGRQRTPPRTLGLLVLASVLVALIFFPQERFRIPVIDPSLIVCAAAWLSGTPAAASREERERVHR